MMWLTLWHWLQGYAVSATGVYSNPNQIYIEETTQWFNYFDCLIREIILSAMEAALPSQFKVHMSDIVSGLDHVHIIYNLYIITKIIFFQKN